MVQEITDTWSQEVWDLRNYLLSKSPYLSVEALKELMDKPGIPNAIKGEILIANPDATKKDGFLLWAEEESAYPLPGYLAANVEASWDTKTYRTTLEENLTDRHTELTQTAYYAMRLLQDDTVPPDPDTLRWVWQQVRTNGARYNEASLLMGQGNYDAAFSVIDSMPAEKELKSKEESERGRMLIYMDVLRTAHNEDRSPYQLSRNEQTTLEQMVGDHYDRPSNWASNLLCAVYGICRAPYTGEAPTPPSSRRIRDLTEPVEYTGTYTLQPNPTRNWVAFNYQHKEDVSGKGYIAVRDLTGRTVSTIQMTGNVGQRVWDTTGIAPGTYSVQFIVEDQVVRSEKLVIQK